MTTKNTGYAYGKLAVAVDMVIFTVKDDEQENYRKLPEKKLQVLLVKRKEEPYKGMWALPGGFVKPGENLEEAAGRELKEETSIENVYMEQLYTWGDVQRDPRSRVISVSYMALVDSSLLSVQAGDDAEDAKWFTVGCRLLRETRVPLAEGYSIERLFQLSVENGENILPADILVDKQAGNRIISINRQVIQAERIAFDHAKILHYCLERLRNKVEYTNIAFSLMPEYFSLTELQKVYEIILDKELLAANFRRKIADMVVETNQRRVDAGHRPSRLYKFNSAGAEEKM